MIELGTLTQLTGNTENTVSKTILSDRNAPFIRLFEEENSSYFLIVYSIDMTPGNYTLNVVFEEIEDELGSMLSSVDVKIEIT